jgi:hypothetical protein
MKKEKKLEVYKTSPRGKKHDKCARMSCTPRFKLFAGQLWHNAIELVAIGVLCQKFYQSVDESTMT